MLDDDTDLYKAEEPPIGKVLEPLSDDSKEKVQILKELLPPFIKEHGNGWASEEVCGKLFDQLYDKDISYLRMLNETFK